VPDLSCGHAASLGLFSPTLTSPALLRAVFSNAGEVKVAGWSGVGLQLREAFRLGPADVGGPAQLLEDPDDAGGRVELATQDAVPGCRRIGVVHVVPALA